MHALMFTCRRTCQFLLLSLCGRCIALAASGARRWLGVHRRGRRRERIAQSQSAVEHQHHRPRWRRRPVELSQRRRRRWSRGLFPECLRSERRHECRRRGGRRADCPDIDRPRSQYVVRRVRRLLARRQRGVRLERPRRLHARQLATVQHQGAVGADARRDRGRRRRLSPVGFAAAVDRPSGDVHRRGSHAPVGESRHNEFRGIRADLGYHRRSAGQHPGRWHQWQPQLVRRLGLRAGRNHGVRHCREISTPAERSTSPMR